MALRSLTDMLVFRTEGWGCIARLYFFWRHVKNKSTDMRDSRRDNELLGFQTQDRKHLQIGVKFRNINKNSAEPTSMVKSQK